MYIMRQTAGMNIYRNIQPHNYTIFNSMHYTEHIVNVSVYRNLLHYPCSLLAHIGGRIV